MYEWRLCATVKQCISIPINHELQYHLLLKLGTKFSNPLPAAQLSSSGIIFNANLELQFTTANCDLPAPNIQLLLVARESILSPRGINTRKEQIIAIATLPVTYPLAQSHAVPVRYKFDKPADSKANIRVSFSLSRAEPSPTRRQRARSPSPSPTGSPTKNQSKTEERRREEESEESGGKMSIKREEWQQILKERNQLYKMSENLYEELRKCMAQRDEYLRQLRQKQLSEQQTREELEFLKLKLQEDHAQHPDNLPLLQQIEELRCQNEEMREKLSERETDLRELERRVKQSLIAMDQFRKQAMSARTDLIHKESQLSLISRQSKHLDLSQCIQELYRQLDNRRYEEPFYFDQERYKVETMPEKAAERIKKEMAAFFTQLIGKLKIPKDREWLMHEKVALQRKITQILTNN